jgi:hypothetical protein
MLAGVASMPSFKVVASLGIYHMALLSFRIGNINN